MKMTTSKGRSGQNKIIQLLKLPIRAFSRARDYYVRSMMDCTQISRCRGAHEVGAMSPSFNMAGSSVVLDDHRSEDFRELIRAASVRKLKVSTSSKIRVVGRSVSVGLGMEKIDEEDTEFEVNDHLDDETRGLKTDDRDDGGRKQNLVFRRRSRSYAVKGIAF